MWIKLIWKMEQTNKIAIVSMLFTLALSALTLTLSIILPKMNCETIKETLSIICGVLFGISFLLFIWFLYKEIRIRNDKERIKNAFLFKIKTEFDTIYEDVKNGDITLEQIKEQLNNDTEQIFNVYGSMFFVALFETIKEDIPECTETE